MALKLHIPDCIQIPAHRLHLPEPSQPLRIQIEGPTLAIERLLPTISWQTDPTHLHFPQPAGPALARLAFKAIYKMEPKAGDDMVVRDEYLGWIVEQPLSRIDYYGVTFDHLVTLDESDPDVLQVNIIEVENDAGAYATEWLPFKITLADYTGKMVLAVPRCCQKRKGSQDRTRVNSSVAERVSSSSG
ncbi:hypothetical protein PG994_010003 [Apiospora phragmitis]|uniref:Uncharacterized protein n=1 Tax=Apiospora phragmitis TaxID=2905665 RepID=A0ABR1TRC2_9PEZI